jgi:hypothetical protein
MRKRENEETREQGNKGTSFRELTGKFNREHYPFK